MKMIWNRLRILLCRYTHGSITRPVHGRYSCMTCQRVYPCLWDIPERSRQ